MPREIRSSLNALDRDDTDKIEGFARLIRPLAQKMKYLISQLFRFYAVVLRIWGW